MRLVKSRRDVRPNNGFLRQLLELERTLETGLRGDLVMLRSKEGGLLVKEAEQQGSSILSLLQQHHGKQTGGSLCGVRSCCIVLNSLGILTQTAELYTEEGFWSTPAAREVVEEVVRREGMTLEQCGAILRAAGVVVEVWGADRSSLQHFTGQAEQVSSSGGSHLLLLNYHMETLGQAEGLGGHLSPLGGVVGGRGLVMDVWPQTRECWAPLEMIWKSMDTMDKSSGAKRGFIVLVKPGDL